MESTASETADALKEAGEATAAHARRALDDAQECAETLAARGSEALQNGAAQARKTFVRVGNQAAQYVQDQPLKSLLIAVATGAAIALLAGALSRHRHDR